MKSFKTSMFFLVLVSLGGFLFFYGESWAVHSSCDPRCATLQKQLDEHQSSLKYLQEIKKQNLEFIAHLDQDEVLSRAKALSNLKVADQRISKVKQLLEKLNATQKRLGCFHCRGA